MVADRSAEKASKRPIKGKLGSKEKPEVR